MHAEDKKKIKTILADVKAAYLSVRGRGGLNRMAPDGAAEEVEQTEWMDEELDEAFKVYLRSQLAEALGVESWIRPPEEA